MNSVEAPAANPPKASRARWVTLILAVISLILPILTIKGLVLFNKLSQHPVGAGLADDVIPRFFLVGTLTAVAPVVGFILGIIGWRRDGGGIKVFATISTIFNGIFLPVSLFIAIYTSSMI